MPKEFDDCVNALIKKGKSKDSAYAICVANYKKKHGKSPFSKEQVETLLINKNLKDILIKLVEGNTREQKLSEKALEAMNQGKSVKIVEDCGC